MNTQAAIGGYFQQAWLVLLLAGTLSAALAFVDNSLQPRIEKHARDRLQAAIFEVVPGGTSSERLERGDHIVYRVTDQDGQHVGWAVPAETMGFVDKIQLMIGLDAQAEKILGLVVLESKETPGLGEKIRSPTFRDGFSGQSATANLEVVKAGQSAEHPVQAITGATISSQAVTEGVNRQLSNVRAALAEEGNR